MIWYLRNISQKIAALQTERQNLTFANWELVDENQALKQALESLKEYCQPSDSTEPSPSIKNEKNKTSAHSTRPPLTRSQTPSLKNTI